MARKTRANIKDGAIHEVGGSDEFYSPRSEKQRLRRRRRRVRSCMLSAGCSPLLSFSWEASQMTPKNDALSSFSALLRGELKRETPKK